MKKYQMYVPIKGGDHLCSSKSFVLFIIKATWIVFIGDMRHWSVKSSLFPKKNCTCIFHKIFK